MRRAIHVLLALLALASALAISCSSAPGPGPQSPLTLAKCSACHPAPEDQSLPGETFEKVRTSHGERVPMSVEEWEMLQSALVAP